MEPSALLVSWSPCRIENEEGLIKPCSIADSDDEVDGQLQAAAPLFGLWMYDPADQTQRPVVTAEEGFVISEVIAIEPQSFPDIPDESEFIDPALAAENKGLIIIDSVYQQDEGVVNYAPLGVTAYAEPGTVNYTNRPGRFARVLQPVPIPNDDVLDDLPNDGSAFDLIEILGYVPVEPDGSVSVKVPANTPVMINVTNADGRRISARHEHWLSTAPGEIVRCVGCHNANSDIPHGRIGEEPASLNTGAVTLTGGFIGFLGADPNLLGNELGETMAEVYDLNKPDSDITQIERGD